MFAESFFDELEKIAISGFGKKTYRNPKKDPKGDEKDWRRRRLESALLGASSGLFGPPSAIGTAMLARKGRKLRAALGTIAGGLGGQFLAARLGGGLGAQIGAGTLGGAAGAYLAHGKYNPKVAKREYKKMNA